MITQKCTSCGDTKPLVEFPYMKKEGTYRNQCKLCRSVYQKRYRENNPDKSKPTAKDRRRYALKRYFGITPETYDDMYEKVSGKCEICGKREDTLSVDHCHETGRIRGLLCRLCNTGIGFLGDRAESVERALQYLRKS